MVKHQTGQFKTMGKLTKSGKEEIRKALLRKGLKLESYWKQEVPVFTGQYKNSIEANSEGWDKVVVGTNVPQAPVLEYGLNQGTWPPVDEIKKWVDRKINPPEEELDQITYLVGQEIFESGVDANQSLQRAVRKFKADER